MFVVAVSEAPPPDCHLAGELIDACLSPQDGGEKGDLLNGVCERSSKEPSPGTSPTSGRKSKTSQSSTLPPKDQDPRPQLEGLLHRKHEWEAPNKKASNR